MREVTLAATQFACSGNPEENLQTAESLVREAANQGANIVLLQELFHGPYFCKDQRVDYLGNARPLQDNPLIEHFRTVAKELGVVLPVSYFEEDGNRQFNSIAIVDATGEVLGNYRKAHIPDGPGYQEKFYFSPGNSGFRVWETRFGKLGVGICWDQWFPEAARCMALMGAEMLMYPTAIGSEPKAPEYNSSLHWQNVMRGHAGANLMPLVASNRIGSETSDDGVEVTFYGSSFISDWQGEKLREADQATKSVLVESFDLDEIAEIRRAWGVFRDRRPEMYGRLVE